MSWSEVKKINSNLDVPLDVKFEQLFRQSILHENLKCIYTGHSSYPVQINGRCKIYRIAGWPRQPGSISNWTAAVEHDGYSNIIVDNNSNTPNIVFYDKFVFRESFYGGGQNNTVYGAMGGLFLPDVREYPFIRPTSNGSSGYTQVDSTNKWYSNNDMWNGIFDKPLEVESTFKIHETQIANYGKIMVVYELLE